MDLLKKAKHPKRPKIVRLKIKMQKQILKGLILVRLKIKKSPETKHRISWKRLGIFGFPRPTAFRFFWPSRRIEAWPIVLPV